MSGAAPVIRIERLVKSYGKGEVNDLALILLRNQIAVAIGADPLTPEGMDRWAREAGIVYAEGAFSAPRKE